MSEDNFIMDYLAALQEAEEKGQEEFVCPICGGKAYWRRYEYNGHSFSKCNDCGITVRE